MIDLGKSMYSKEIYKELERIREVLALQGCLMAFNTMAGIERPENDELYLIDIATKLETFAMPEKVSFE